MSERRVGVIDVGSNTIKLLIASRDDQGELQSVHFEVLETRIGEGAMKQPPSIFPEDIERGAEAVKRLREIADSFEVASLKTVATSAARDARNREHFVSRVSQLANCDLNVLNGVEEARYIGEGLRTDPRLKALSSFTLLDMGGGSLECIQFLEKRARLIHSLNLGAVRLASRFVKDRRSPLTTEAEQAIGEHVRATFDDAKINANSSPSPVAVLTGGTAAVLANEHPDYDLDAGLSLDALKAFHRKVARADQNERASVHGVPESRADIFPTATSALCASMEFLGCERVRFSHRNLRFGIASELLTELDSTA